MFWTLSLATIIIRIHKRKLEELRAKAIRFVFLQQGTQEGNPSPEGSVTLRDLRMDHSFIEGPALR